MVHAQKEGDHQVATTARIVAHHLEWILEDSPELLQCPGFKDLDSFAEQGAEWMAQDPDKAAAVIVENRVEWIQYDTPESDAAARAAYEAGVPAEVTAKLEQIKTDLIQALKEKGHSVQIIAASASKKGG